jgi:mRNA interferase MazF
MGGFRAWDIIAVPFPYTDRPVRERRPALVVGTTGIQDEHGLLWVLMVTSAANRGWPGDAPVSDLSAAGLPAASVVRTAKMATIEAKEAERVGVLPSRDRPAIRRLLESTLSETLGWSGKARG